MSIVRIAFLVLTVCSATLNSADAVCNKVYDRGVNKNDQQVIVDKHNALRLLVAKGRLPGQPRGVNLKRMKWDQRLANEAQKIADICEFKHRKVVDSRFYVGQNIYIGMSTGRSSLKAWNDAVQNWFDEYKIYRYPNLDANTGHYTQVVWANTEYVGCGYTYFYEAGAYAYRKLYVCNYGPGGNYVGQAPYKTGRSGCENLC